MVDDRHVAGAQALDEVLGALAEPGDPLYLDRAPLGRRVAVGRRNGHGGILRFMVAWAQTPQPHHTGTLFPAL